MSNKLLLKKSSVAAKVPLTTDLDYGELALNYADGKLYFKNSSNVIQSFSIGGGDVTLTGTQTLTNKTISGSSNTITNISLTTAVTGTLPVANGGTGVTTSTGTGNVVLNTNAVFAGTLTAATGEGLKVTTNNYPAIKPSLLLDFANTKQLDPRITFTRTSTATYYDGVTTAMAEQNLLTYSQDFSNATWTKYNSTVTTDTSMAPDGTTSADTLTDNATNSYHIFEESVPQPSGTYTFSSYIKAGTLGFGCVSIHTDSQAKGYGVVLDLSSGIVTSILTHGAPLNPSYVVFNVGNGWYRIAITITNTAGSILVYSATSNSGTPSSSFALPTYVGSGGTILVWGAQLEQRSSVTAYTATTTQPITNYIPVLLTAAAGVPRFNHNPTTGESLGLMIEESRTNLLTYSEQFDNAAWTAGKSAGASVLANTTVAPNGTITADTVTFTASSDYLIQSIPNYSAVTGASVTISIYAKTSTQIIVFGGASPAGTDVYAFVNVGNGWFKQTVTRTFTVTTSAFPLQTLPCGLFVGAGSFSIWGAQLEAGAFATSYIPTVAATVARSADAASMTGTNFSSWYRPDEGSIYVDALHPATAVNNEVLVSLDDSSAANTRISLYCSGGTNQSGVFISVAGATQANITGSNITNGSPFKVVAAYKVNDFAFVKDSATAGTDTSGTVPGVGLLNIGKTNFIAASGYNGTIKKIAYYPTRLTNAQLQSLTTV